MITTCQRCGKSWGGHKPEHCAVCHETFSGTTSGDKHRTGKHEISVGPDRRRCRDRDELAQIGLVLDVKGIWRMPGDRPVQDLRASQASRVPELGSGSVSPSDSRAEMADR